MTTKLTVLGSGTFQPTINRGCSGYVVQINSTNILMDAGSGTLRQLAKIGIPATQLDKIFITHLHPDHIGDLLAILFAKRCSSEKGLKILKLYGPKGFKKYFESFFKLNKVFLGEVQKYIETIEYSDNKFSFDGWDIFFLKMNHTILSYGFRIVTRDNKIISYTGDTEYCDKIIELVMDSNLSIIECSCNNDEKVTGHMSPKDIITILEKVKCEKVILSHLYPTVDTLDLLENFKSIKSTLR